MISSLLCFDCCLIIVLIRLSWHLMAFLGPVLWVLHRVVSIVDLQFITH